MKKITQITAILLAFSLGTSVSAAPQSHVSLPAQAVEVAPGLYKLGVSYDMKSDNFVEGYAIVHKKSSNAKAVATKSPRSEKCYAVMADGAKWKAIENWTVNSAESGLDANFLLNATNLNIGKWEKAAHANVLGNGSVATGSTSDPYLLDDKNEISFGALESDTIAITIVWGVWSGPVTSRQIVAWDQVFNANYPWSGSGDPLKMDYENISTHELGHAMGLADIYSGSCSGVTMYGYGGLGETQKSTLAPDDVTGINLLY